MFVLTLEDSRATTPESQGELTAADDTVASQLESELRLTREDLQATIEQLETSNEELKASNEEVMSMNEELQSTNEEMETSKEELQSLNEELTTVNNQLQEKVQELESANTDLANLLSSTDIAAIFLDRNFRIKRFTSAMASLLNVIPRDIGRSFGDITRRFEDPDLLADAERVLRNGESSEKEVKSEGRTFVRRVLPYRSLDNEIAGVAITLVDITALNNAYETLSAINEELEARVAQRAGFVVLLQEVAVISNESEDPETAYRTALERICKRIRNAAGHVYVLYGENRFEDAGIWVGDSALIATLRHSRPAIFDSSDSLTGKAVVTRPPEIRAVLRAQAGSGEQIEEGFSIRTVEIPVIALDSVVGVMELLFPSKFDVDENLVNVLGQIGNQLGRVVERRRDQESIRALNAELQSQVDDFETLFQVMPVAVSIARDPESKNVRVNQRFAEILGVSTEQNTSPTGPEAPALPFKWSRNGAPVTPEELPQQVCGRDGVARDNLELDVERADGSIYRLLGNVAPLLDQNRVVRGSVAAYLDVTARKKVEEALSQSNRHLEEFAYAASHDMQGPLRTVAAFSQLVAQKLKNEGDRETQEYLSLIVAAAEQMERLIRGLLSYARAKEEEVEVESVDLNVSVSKALTSLQVGIAQIEAKVICDPLPVVTGNPLHFEQIFTNLISNSLKYRRPDVPLSVSIQAALEEKEWRVSVSDNGLGFEPRHAEQIFRIFTRLNPRDSSGEGVGLAIVKTIVERHGGRVWAESKPGEGATFHLAFPKDSHV